jgi:hypothetical protein
MVAREVRVILVGGFVLEPVVLLDGYAVVI